MLSITNTFIAVQQQQQPSPVNAEQQEQEGEAPSPVNNAEQQEQERDATSPVNYVEQQEQEGEAPTVSVSNDADQQQHEEAETQQQPNDEYEESAHSRRSFSQSEDGKFVQGIQDELHHDVESLIKGLSGVSNFQANEQATKTHFSPRGERQTIKQQHRLGDPDNKKTRNVRACYESGRDEKKKYSLRAYSLRARRCGNTPAPEK